jgi:DNA-binding CsgD family transcriptional regulator
MFANIETGNPYQATWNGYHPSFVTEYTADWADKNPFASPTLRPAPGVVYSGEDIANLIDLEWNQYYREFMLRHDCYRVIGTDLFRTPKFTGLIEFQRPNSCGPTTGEERSLLQSIFPHLTRAAQITWRLWEADALRAGWAATLDQMNQGIVLLDDREKPAYVNRKAVSILRTSRSLTVRAERLKAADTGEDQLLQRFILDAVTAGRGSGMSTGGVVELARPGKAPLNLFVTPLHLPATPSRLPVTRICAAVFIRVPEDMPVEAADAARALYGLTAAESRLALAFARGQSVNDAADTLKITRETTRTVLKRIFSKTGTHRQAELVRLMLNLPITSGVSSPLH